MACICWAVEWDGTNNAYWRCSEKFAINGGGDSTDYVPSCSYSAPTHSNLQISPTDLSTTLTDGFADFGATGSCPLNEDPKIFIGSECTNNASPETDWTLTVQGATNNDILVEYTGSNFD